MQAAATPHPSDRKDFANRLAEVRAMDDKGEYTKPLNDLEVEYQFILLRSLDLFHKEMLRAQLPDRLHDISRPLQAGRNKIPKNTLHHTHLSCRPWIQFLL